MRTYAEEKVDEVVLALLTLTIHERCRAWKSFDWDTMNRLYAKGSIADPRGKSTSVVLSEEGLAAAEHLFEQYVGKRTDA